MTDSVQYQSYVFAMCFLGGAVFGLIFDFFRIIRRTARGGRTLVNLCDALFWSFSAVFFTWWMFCINDGSLRWYVFFSFGAGAMLYFSVLSRFFVKIGVFVLSVVKRVLLFVLKLVFIPIKYIAKKTGRAAVFVFTPIRKNARRFAKNRIRAIKGMRLTLHRMKKI